MNKLIEKFKNWLFKNDVDEPIESNLKYGEIREFSTLDEHLQYWKNSAATEQRRKILVKARAAKKRKKENGKARSS